MADETKTKEQLIAEIEVLKKELERPTSKPGEPASTEHAPQVVVTPVTPPPNTRRGALSWIAPVILSLGTAIKPGTARAANTDDFVPPPAPTVAPTPRTPTATPTVAATAAPTTPPTPAPTAVPTRAGRCIPMPTASPTAAPTLGMASAPDARANTGGFVALGSARAAARLKLADSLPHPALVFGSY